MERPMSQFFDASRSLTALEQDSTMIAAIEMSQSNWLVAAIVPGVERQPLKKLDADEEALLKLCAELRRHLARLRVVREQIRAIEQERLRKLAATPAGEKGPHVMVRLIARLLGVGVETADMLVNEILSRHLRDRKAVARYAGLTGSPDESGRRRRERGLARAGNARVRCGMIQLAWRFLRFQKDSALAQWFHARTTDGRGSTRKTMIVALARKLLIALWRLVTTGDMPQGVVLRPAS
jgi:transposase